MASTDNPSMPSSPREESHGWGKEAPSRFPAQKWLQQPDFNQHAETHNITNHLFEQSSKTNTQYLVYGRPSSKACVCVLPAWKIHGLIKLT